MQLLKRILTAVVLIPIVLVLVLRAPVPAVALVAALVALLPLAGGRTSARRTRPRRRPPG